MDSQYEVFSPWAARAPVPLLGIQPRMSNLASASIGFVPIDKIAAIPILTEVEKNLKAKFPTLKSSGIYKSQDDYGRNVDLADWIKGVDTAVLAVGD